MPRSPAPSAFSLPTTWEFSSYSKAAARGDIWTSGRNSLLIAVIKVPLGVLISAAAAFSIARFRFKWHRVVLIIIAVGAMVPVQVALAPMFTLMSSLGLLNSDLGIILPYLAFGGFFFSVILPVSKPALGRGAPRHRARPGRPRCSSWISSPPGRNMRWR